MILDRRIDYFGVRDEHGAYCWEGTSKMPRILMVATIVALCSINISQAQDRPTIDLRSFNYLTDHLKDTIELIVDNPKLERHVIASFFHATCGVIKRINEDKNFHHALRYYMSKRYDSENDKLVAKSFSDFSFFLGFLEQERDMLLKAEFSEKEVDIILSEILRVRSSLENFNTSYDDVANSLKQLQKQSCAASEDVIDKMASDELKSKIFNSASILVGLAVVGVNGSSLVPTAGLSFLSVLIGGYIATGYAYDLMFN